MAFILSCEKPALSKPIVLTFRTLDEPLKTLDEALKTLDELL